VRFSSPGHSTRCCPNVGRNGMYLATRDWRSDDMPTGKSYVLDSFCCNDDDKFWVSVFRILFQYAKPRSSSVPRYTHSHSVSHALCQTAHNLLTQTCQKYLKLLLSITADMSPLLTPTTETHMHTWNNVVHDKAHDATNKHGRSEEHNTDIIHSFISCNRTCTHTHTYTHTGQTI